MNKNYLIIISVLAIIYFVFTLLVQVLNRHTDWKQLAISNYIHLQHSWMIKISFTAISLSLLLSSMFIYSYLSISHAFVFMLLASIGAFLVTIFPTDKSKEIRTTTGKIHSFGAALVFYLFPISILLLHQSSDIPTIKSISIITAAVMLLIGFVLAVLYFSKKFKSNRSFGLLEKTLIFAMNFWLIVCPLVYFIS